MIKLFRYMECSLCISFFLFIIQVYNCEQINEFKNEFANPTLDYSFVTVFTAVKNKALLIKFLNDLLEPDDDELIMKVKQGPDLYPASKMTRQLTTFDVLCESKSGTIIVQVQMRNVYHNFVKEVQTDAIWSYYREDELFKNGATKKIVRLLVVSNCLLFPDKHGPLHPLSQHKWMDKRTHKVVFKDISMTFFEIPKCKAMFVKDIQDATDLWCYYFKQVESASKKEILRLEKNFPIMKKALDSLFVGGWGEKKIKYYRHLAEKHLADVHSLEHERVLREKEIAAQYKKIAELRQQIKKDKELVRRAKKITQLFKERIEKELNGEIQEFKTKRNKTKIYVDNKKKEIMQLDNHFKEHTKKRTELEINTRQNGLTMDDRIKELAIKSYKKRTLNEQKNGSSNLGEGVAKYDKRIFELDKEIEELNADIEGSGKSIDTKKSKTETVEENKIKATDYENYDIEDFEKKTEVVRKKSLQLEKDIEEDEQIAELNKELDWLGQF